MRVAVFGLGYVGCTALCCMASEGHRVFGFDVNQGKVELINGGQSPIIEPGIGQMLADGVREGLISAHQDIGNLLDDCDLAIVCVGTPSAPDGSLNMDYIAEVSGQVARAAASRTNGPLTVSFRSTIRPGTMEGLVGPIFADALGADFEEKIELVYNPEFLRESSAVEDYFAPPKVVVGTRDGKPSARMDELNRTIEAQTFNVRYGEAELVKFVDNSWHALKVAYANEIGRVCLQHGLSATKMHEMFISDTKLNVSPYYLRPGGAFGGSCLPKDVRALQHISAQSGAHTHVIDALIRSNEAHKFRLFQLATEGLESGATVLLAGIAFKANTDDLRESPNIDLARSLLAEGYKLSIYDPAVDPGKLVGANLGYAYTQLPTLAQLLVTRESIENTRFARVIVANGTGAKLKFCRDQEVVDLNSLN